MRIGVIGAGAWGTALAQVAAAGGEEVLLWAREPEVFASVNAAHENAVFLKGVPLGESIRATGDLGGRALSALVRRGANVRALVRSGTPA